MATKEDNRMMDLSRAAISSTVEPQDNAGLQRGQKLMAAGGLLAALAASSCCVLPLVLFSLGVSGAWIGNFTQLAPYQHCFVAATIAFLGTGYWLVYRSSKLGCTDGEARARHRNSSRDRRARRGLPVTPLCRSLKESQMAKLALTAFAFAMFTSSNAF